jgi:DNA-directed RNA polymerase subunit L
MYLFNDVLPERAMMSSCSPRVSFTGYSIPHPSENRVNIRVQTTGKIYTLSLATYWLSCFLARMLLNLSPVLLSSFIVT